MFGIGPLELIILFVIAAPFLAGVAALLYVVGRERKNRPPNGAGPPDSNRDQHHE